MKSRPCWMGAATISMRSAGQGRRRSQACAVASLKSRCTHTKSTSSVAASASAKSPSRYPNPLRNSKANSGRPSLTFCKPHPNLLARYNLIFSAISCESSAFGHRGRWCRSARKLPKCVRQSPPFDNARDWSAYPLTSSCLQFDEGKGVQVARVERLKITGRSLRSAGNGFLASGKFRPLPGRSCYRLITRTDEVVATDVFVCVICDREPTTHVRAIRAQRQRYAPSRRHL